MSIAGLAMDASTQNPIVLLRDPSRRRQIPIWIDHAQAHNIMTGIQKPASHPPLTHDLMVALLKEGGMLLEKVVIHAIKENTFQAILKIRLQQKNQEDKDEAFKTIEMDAKPSDAIAMAVRTHCSIWMLEEVVAAASIPVDAEADEEDQDEFRRFVDQISPAALISHLKTRPPTQEEDFRQDKDSNQSE